MAVAAKSASPPLPEHIRAAAVVLARSEVDHIYPLTRSPLPPHISNARSLSWKTCRRSQIREQQPRQRSEASMSAPGHILPAHVESNR
ncbi:hypothetical protein GJAV_G00006040 [Gymnothorax javanicus]|nr:hypothetical protein GJAV_G00006040 [Gymnothorax javanicus]